MSTVTGDGHAAVQGLIERGLVRIGVDVQERSAGPFTKAGVAALRLDRRQLEPLCHAHVRQEFGLAVQTSEKHI